jgi:Ferritin-like domain
MAQDEADRIAASRRTFLRGAGMTGIGLAGAAMIGSKFGAREQKVEAAAAVSDLDILNFALNLEYLEAEFYAMSTYGATLVQLGVIKSSDESGPTTGGAKIPNFSASRMATVATALRNDEILHVKYLRAALGSRAVKKPAINLNALAMAFRA